MCRKNSPPFAPGLAWLPSLPLLALVALVGACSDRPDDYQALTLNEPEKRHEIGFTERSESLLVEVVPGGEGLSDNQQVDVVRFVGRYKAESSGRLRIVTPSGAREHSAAERSLREVRAIAAESGIAPRAIAVEYRRASNPRTALQLSYERPVAVPPLCGDWSEDLGPNHERVHYPNFGCATQRGLALMVANPRDLVEPRAETPRGSDRREVTWSNYVKGGSGSSAPAASPAASNGSSAPATK